MNRNRTQEALKTALVQAVFLGDKTIIDCIKFVLAQPAQEPVAWATEWEDGEWSVSHSPNMGKQSIPLYTHPAPAKGEV